MDNDFFDRVYDICRRIPRGRVTTYGAIARAAGAPRGARMVGWAMNKSGSITPAVPAHRVLNRNGMLSGKHAFATPGTMQQLLESEGIEVKDDRVTDFEKLFWDPMKLSEF
jgi:methylated-DNA-protein-cysteine methyltransferase-like protein